MLQMKPKIFALCAVMFLAFVLIQWSLDSVGAGTEECLEQIDGGEIGSPEIGPLCDELAVGADVFYPLNATPEIAEHLAPAVDDGRWKQYRGVMEWEVELLWDLFFRDDGAKPSDPRRNNFGLFATYVVDAVLMYQDGETDLGGRLPLHRNVHLLVAWLIAKESSVTPGVKGKMGEVGMMQIMPNNRAALAGYHPERVNSNPDLSIMLGVRWLAYTTTECPSIDTENPLWDDWDWAGPLSVYAGGTQRAKRKDGTCKSFTIAEERIRRTLLYRARIDHRSNPGNLAI